MQQKAGMENFQANFSMDEDQVSVVLAVYRGEKFLTKLLDSVFGQKDVFIKELIVVDDRSSDGSSEIIKGYQQKHSNIKLIANEVNLGPIGSFKKGASLATSKYIAFADQDDIWTGTKLSSSLDLLKKIDTGNAPAMVFTDLAMIDEEDNPLHDSFWELYKIKPAENNFYTVLFGNIVTGCTIVINRKMLEEFLVMPVEAPMHDHWLALIAFSFGSYGYLDDRTVLYRVHQNSVTNKNEITFGKVIKNFLAASFSKDSNFLDDYIKQAELFKARYADKLNKLTCQQLDKFIKLKSSSGFARKLNSKFRFYKTSNNF
jgi:glycosyltransferase involved in cell wall biosynthesis